MFNLATVTPLLFSPVILATYFSAEFFVYIPSTAQYRFFAYDSTTVCAASFSGSTLSVHLQSINSFDRSFPFYASVSNSVTRIDGCFQQDDASYAWLHSGQRNILVNASGASRVLPILSDATYIDYTDGSVYQRAGITVSIYRFSELLALENTSHLPVAQKSFLLPLNCTDIQVVGGNFFAIVDHVIYKRVDQDGWIKIAETNAHSFGFTLFKLQEQSSSWNQIVVPFFETLCVLATMSVLYYAQAKRSKKHTLNSRTTLMRELKILK